MALSFFVMPVSSAYDGAYNVKVGKDFVMAKAKCSCGLSSWARTHTSIYENYCPNCHHSGCIQYEEGSASWTSPENYS